VLDRFGGGEIDEDGVELDEAAGFGHGETARQAAGRSGARRPFLYSTPRSALGAVVKKTSRQRRTSTSGANVSVPPRREDTGEQILESVHIHRLHEMMIKS
jgi:hypothetical protein